MNLHLSARELELRERSRRYCDEHLLPLELACDERDGLTLTELAPAIEACLTAPLNAVNFPIEWGGQGFSIFEQVLSQEQLGRATNALWDVPRRPANVLRHCTAAQREEYLLPEIAMRRWHAYAITEPGAGSDPSRLATRAVRDGTGYRISGEKWFVTVGDIADYLIVVADLEGHGPTSFLVDRDLPGVRELRRPRYTHAFVFEHPEIGFDGVRVAGDKVLGEPGGGLELTKEWFAEERLMIAARCLGGAERCLEEALAYATEREQFGQAIIDYQGVSFPLADSAVELAAARAMTYQVAWEITDGALEAKTVHAKSAAVKLFASEVAGRIADRAVQILGGRGYMRDHPVERLNRDLRVDRIWEGTSEIQRVIVANELRKRGPHGVSAWPSASRF